MEVQIPQLLQTFGQKIGMLSIPYGRIDLAQGRGHFKCSGIRVVSIGEDVVF